ncbi:acyl-CoA thioesterase II [Pseudohoeflea coraliihabitans]|uniref:Acyl-CoA thioesterase II n=1 Tax=Pseudohoeflea coraliihabitans TaxID=2860393 RepID=A0ABS6WLN4_9HYPH|nr:acyl-CoA thioesterase II [Pseudohoeflea sp. DP4N28-3]MBW3096805.1 acyl-CoA thioesterase II [Pseudohoeflea sp. DP4N28-3]
MSRSEFDSTAALIGYLDLEALEKDLFRGQSPQLGWQRTFGGQVIGQSLVAAQRTVEAERAVHSMHAYFLRPGDPATPIIFTVDRIRDGTSFSTRNVVAIQHGKAIFSLSASFQKEEEGLEYQAEMPEVPQPEALAGTGNIDASFLEGAPQVILDYWKKQRPIEVRPVFLEHYVSDKPLPPIQHAWVRTLGPVPEDRVIQASILAYLSDMLLLDTTLFAHGTNVFDRSIQAASLDHAMWFHRPFDFSDWLLYTMDSPNTNGARGFARGSLYSRDGALVASVAQEGLIRPRRSAAR